MSHLTAAGLTRAHRSWWPWALGFVIVVGTFGSNRELAGDREVAWLAGVVATLAVVPLVLDARHHVSLVFTGFWTGVYFASAFADGPMYLALPALTYLHATETAARRWVPWAVAGGALAGAGFVWDAVRDGDHRSFWQTAGFLAITAAAGAVGAALRSRTEARAERVERTATEEKLRMAQDLHDGVGHGLAVIAMQAGAALHVLDTDPARARASLEAIRATSKESLDALRAELAAMSGGRIGAAAPRRPAAGLDALPELVDRVRAAGLRVDVVGDAGAVPARVGEAVHAVVQEALTNVLRHAEASRVTVTLDRALDTTLVVTVADDGRDAADAGEPGMGLAGMRARVESVGGRFAAGPATGAGESGYRVRAELPLSGEDGAR